ncbi:type II toxin-antitoxin system RelE/ParE family toxin [Shewanella sp. 4t3-1-2LB]|uniref:type II toxin-antitoxin system RelE/ParE family toxin n=1 Tax=Shewanella sp. 4t3-1-2LB TaxID=2817682 RepID=UPI001A994C66|nr:type II toxin-antitoxin system RelE/ParE family toxin [Shewanella sp. 4t3-1-2LB]MBO1272865.1 type II toxin-antitoxin system RelE/ParE family toxin [Shewanella sp. 4t3-1-2LB]
MFELIFHPEAEAEILALASNMQGKALRALSKLEAEGHQLRFPDTKLIRDGLFELRAGGKDITRTFFAFSKGKKIYILRTFVKKTTKTPPSEIELALSRLEQLL